MKTLNEIKSILEKHKDELKEKYGVKEIGVFGSYIRGEQERRSDVDILVEFDEPPNMFEFIDLKEYLAHNLGTEVDLVMKSALKPTIGKYILEEVVMI